MKTMNTDENVILTRRMQSNIKMRKESDIWDLAIAGRVINHRRKIQASFAGAVAAICVVTFLFNPIQRDKSQSVEMYSFINSQVENTRKQVFKQKTTNATRSSMYLNYVSYDAVDNVIESSMTERLR